MFRILGNKFVVLTLVVILMALSSFSIIYNTSNEIPGNIIKYLRASAPVYLNRVIDDYIAENEQETGNEENYSIPEPVYIELNVPDILPIYTALKPNVSLFNTRHGVMSHLTLFMDDEILFEEWIETDTELSTLAYNFEYTRELTESVDIRAELQYTTEDGVEHHLTDEKTVLLENHDKTHWMELESERVLGLVSSTYKGDRTLEWALENDYDDFDKEVFVSMKGYESDTAYLIWVNRAYQRANIFIGSAGNWSLIETFIVATGSQTSMTRRGVSKIPSRTEAGWNFGSFIVEPVVRFFPGSRYAFHSRPLYPRSKEVKDERIGFPVSAGCVRMYCDDIWFIYHNIPDGTTVVIY